MRNEDIANDLIHLAQQEKLPHAVILQGEDDLGKQDVVSMVAKAIVCESIKKPCNSCKSCNKSNNHTHPDVILLEPLAPTNTFKIETIREIRKNAYILPNEAPKKIYILKSAERMTKQAQNAFLKILEDPPRHVIFFLICRSAALFLPTIRSRCQVYSIKTLTTDQMLCFLDQNYKTLELGDKQKIAEISDGNMGMAVRFLEDRNFRGIYQGVQDFIDALINDKKWESLKSIAAISNQKASFINYLSILESVFRKAYLNYYVPDDKNNMAKRLSKTFTPLQIIKLIKILDNSKRYLESNVSLNLVASSLCSVARFTRFDEPGVRVC